VFDQPGFRDFTAPAHQSIGDGERNRGREQEGGAMSARNEEAAVKRLNSDGETTN